MKLTPTAIALIAFLGSHLVAQEDTKKYEAEILRSISGNALDEKGFSQGSVPLKKGMIYRVLEQSFSDVILDNDGKRIKVGKNDVRLSEAKATDEEGASGAGFLRIVSAKYGRPNDRQYEVKEEIKKRLPKGPITNPVEILVSDALLRSRAGYMTQTGVLQGNVVIMQKDTPCILTITYEYNGERLKKEVMEGRNLVLP
jgi:hypothetical protein